MEHHSFAIFRMRSTTQLIRDSLFILFAVYYGQDWLYTSGSILSQLCIVCIISISGVYFVKTLLLEDKKPLFYWAWTFFLILNIIGFIVDPNFLDLENRDMFKNILGCMFPFYPFYYFAVKGHLKASNLRQFFLLILPVMIFRFFTTQNNIILELSTDESDVVNNFAYSFVFLIPFVFLFRKKLISGILLLVLIAFIIQSAKRGAIVAGLIGVLIYFYYQLKTIEVHNRLISYLTAILVIAGISTFAYLATSGNQFTLARMSSILQGQSSNRDIIYRGIFTAWNDSETVLNFIFGFGFASSLRITGSYAHNDWLELLSNFGLTGFLFYLLLFYAAVKQSIVNTWDQDKRVVFLTIIIMWFFITLVSMWYPALFGFTQAIILGYLLGNKSNSLA
jgi:O-antigen ligase